MGKYIHLAIVVVLFVSAIVLPIDAFGSAEYVFKILGDFWATVTITSIVILAMIVPLFEIP